MVISRGLTKAHFNWKTKCKFALGILNSVLKIDSRKHTISFVIEDVGWAKQEFSGFALKDKHDKPDKNLFPYMFTL